MPNDIATPFCQNSSVYSIQKTDIEKCARLMARAFNNDPSIRYLLGGADEGKNDWKYFNALLKALFGKCVMLSAHKDIKELIVLFPPSLKGVPTLPFLLNGGILLPFVSKMGLFKRSVKYEANCQRVKNRFVTDNTWYMLCFVVEPEIQHMGYGSALLKNVLNVLDSENARLYLETHKAVNVEIYKHFGFDLKDTTVIPDTVISQYAMLR